MADRLLLISFVGGEEGYCAVLGGAGGARAVRTGAGEPLRASSEEPIGEGRAALSSPRGEIEVSWSPAGPMLEFATGPGTAVRAHAIAASLAGTDDPLSGPGVLWDLPASGYSALRTAWAATAKSTLTLLIATRPEGSNEHGEETVGAARIIPGAEPYGYVEPLLSTEYDAAGAHTRATLELWQAEDEGAPERGAGTRLGGASLSADGAQLEAARFRWALDGSAAIGAYEILAP